MDGVAVCVGQLGTGVSFMSPGSPSRGRVAPGMRGGRQEALRQPERL